MCACCAGCEAYRKQEVFCRGKVLHFSHMVYQSRSFYATLPGLEMALFKYLKRINSKGDKKIQLPAENGLLSQVILPLIIKEANKAVSDAIKEKRK